MGDLERLEALLRADSDLPPDTLVGPPAGAGADGLGARAAAGERARGREPEYALLVETIHEGYLQHYGEGRVVRPADRDLALLAGDRLYALGLSQLAALGDLEGVAVLADVISRCAQAHAEDRAGDAEAIWALGASAVGAGTGRLDDPLAPAPQSPG